jgi:hypothetical protein
MMMEFMKEKLVMVKSMERENIILKMEMYMKAKCIRGSCRAKESMFGQIKMFMKGHFCKIR